MLVFLIISFLAAVVIIWQWVKTVRVLDALSAGQGNLRFVLPKTEDNFPEAPSKNIDTTQTQ